MLYTKMGRSNLQLKALGAWSCLDVSFPLILKDALRYRRPIESDQHVNAIQNDDALNNT